MNYMNYENQIDRLEKLDEITTVWAKQTVRELQKRDWSQPRRIRTLEDPPGALLASWENAAGYIGMELHAGDGDVVIIAEPATTGMKEEEIPVAVYDKCRRDPDRTADVFEDFTGRHFSSPKNLFA